MSPENKQRIVGIVVLVAFIALLIPFLFTSGLKKKEQAVGSNETTTSIPVNETSAPAPSAELSSAGNLQTPPAVAPTATETLSSSQLPKEESNSAANAVDLPVTTTEVATSNTPSVPSVPNVANVTNVPSVPSVPSVSNVPSVPETATNVIPEANVAATEANNIKEPVVTTPKSVTKTKLATKKLAVAKGNSKLSWSVQVGSFSDKQRMQKMVSKLQASGYKVFLQKISTTRGLMIRVLVGREATQAKAEKISQQLNKKLKLNGRVVNNKK